MVIADLTGWNPNVFYELALRHVVRKPIVQLIQYGERIPFDVAQNRTIEVDRDLDSVNTCKRELEKQIRAVEEDATLIDNPISFAIDVQLGRESNKPIEQTNAEIMAMLADLRVEVRGIAQVLRTMGTIQGGTYPMVTSFLPGASLKPGSLIANPTSPVFPLSSGLPYPFVSQASDEILNIIEQLDDESKAKLLRVLKQNFGNTLKRPVSDDKKNK
jgi:hypothetical protein